MAAAEAKSLPLLRVSENKRFLATTVGI